MDLFLIRHAPAVHRQGDLADEARPLTPQGARRFRRAVRGLDRLGVGFDRLYHGPSLRSVQTADLLARLVEIETTVTTTFAQSPKGTLLEEIAGERVAIVGQSPWIGQLLGWLILGSIDQTRRFVLGPGDVAWLEGQPRSGGMTLRALLPCKVLRKLDA